MNREIEFKIFANGKWYAKCLVGNTNNTSDDNWTCPLVWSDKKKEWVHCDNGVICQYTGLKDRKGTKIFEGYIVKVIGKTFDGKIRELIGEIIYIDCSFALKTKEYNFHLYADLQTNYEVIGNIYENKELLGNA